MTKEAQRPFLNRRAPWLGGLPPRVLVVVLVSIFWASSARAGFLKSYKEGKKAVEQGRWEVAERKMREAIAGRSKESPRITKRAYFQAYIPHYYLGLALFERGDCDGALASWNESQRQGFITGRKEFEDIEAKRLACAQATRGQTASDPRNAEPDPGEARDPTPSALPQPESTPQDAAARREAVRARGPAAGKPAAEPPAPQPGKPVDPPQRLVAAAEAYFTRSYGEAIEILAELRPAGRKSLAHASLLLAAAHFALHRTEDPDEHHLAIARQKIRECHEAEPSLRPLKRFFSPSFIRFFDVSVNEGAGG